VLLGYRVDEQLVVTAMITGGRGALRTRTSYQPDLQWQNARIAEHYERSAGGTSISGLAQPSEYARGLPQL
jgi:integrative and conjugative element protein (TIGR02256 family)